MLNTADHDKIKAAIQQTIELLGVPAVWSQTQAPNQTKNIHVGFKNVGNDDTELVNAYGIDAIIITMMAKDFTTEIPEKFDTLTVAGTTYNLDVVKPHRLNGEIIFYKSIVRGG